MKANQSLTITVENGHAVFTTADGNQNRHAIPPFDSLFKTTWNALFDLPRDPEMEILIHYNGATYRWDITYAHYCFAEGRMSEKYFAGSILVPSNEEEA